MLLFCPLKARFGWQVTSRQTRASFHAALARRLATRGGGVRHRRCNHQYCSGAMLTASASRSLYQVVSVLTLEDSSPWSWGSAIPLQQISNRIGFRWSRRVETTIIGALEESENRANALWQEAGAPMKSTQQPLSPACWSASNDKIPPFCRC